jgi:hypothetical protein
LPSSVDQTSPPGRWLNRRLCRCDGCDKAFYTSLGREFHALREHAVSHAGDD